MELAIRLRASGAVNPMGGLFEAPPVVSLQRQLLAAERELKRRRQVYPSRVAQHRMSEKLANEETAAMAAIVDTLQRLLEAERRES
jgi:hypothetical protein